jgi:hypothetical protein
VDKVDRFAKRAPFPVRIFVNAVNGGSTANFEKAIRLCIGDIIVLSDQDDIWLPWRLFDTGNAFAANPSLGCVFGNGYVVDETGAPTGCTLWRSFDFTRLQRLQINRGHATLALLNRHIATGATMAFRSAIKECCLPIPSVWTHDAWIALISSCRYGVGLLPRPVIKYRQHPRQQIGATHVDLVGKIKRPRKLGVDGYERVVAQYEAALNRVATIEGTAGKMKLVAAKLQHLHNRHLLPRHRGKRIAIVTKELLSMRYTLYSTGVMGALRDLTVSADSLGVLDRNGS